MRIVMLSPFSSQAASSRRLASLAKNMAHRTKIVLPRTDKYGTSEGSEMFYFPIGVKSFLKLPLYVLRSLGFMRRENPEIVYFVKPHLFTFIPAFLYKLFNPRCELVFDCDEWDPSTLRDNNAPSYQVMLTEAIAKLSMRFAGKIIYSNGLIKRDKIPARHWGKSFYLPNGVDSEAFRVGAKKGEGFNLLFIGLLYRVSHIVAIVDAMVELSKSVKGVKCYIVGDGPRRKELEGLVGSKGLGKHFMFTGMVEHGKLPRLMGDAEVLLAPFSDSEGARYQSNVKIFEYMASGKPIVASDVGEIRKVLADGRAGYVVPPGDSKALAEAVLRIYKHKEESEKKSKYARELAEDVYDWKVLAEKLSNYLVSR